MRLAVVLVLAAGLLAQAPVTEREKRGRATIEAALAALGGGMFLGMQDRIEYGRAYQFYRDRLTGLAKSRTYTRYLTRPEPPQPGFFGLRERQAYGKDEDAWTLFLEDGTGFDVTFRGAKPIATEVVERVQLAARMNILYILRMRLGEPGLIVEHTGIDVFENQPVDKVDITDSENRVITVLFHQSTHLPVRQLYFRRNAVTRERDEEVTLFSKYRDVGGGVMWPFAQNRIRNGEKVFELFSETVTINNSLADNIFTISTDTKVIEKKASRKP